MELSHMHLVDLLSSLKHDYIVNSPMNSYPEEKKCTKSSALCSNQTYAKQMIPPQLNRVINNN